MSCSFEVNGTQGNSFNSHTIRRFKDTFILVLSLASLLTVVIRTSANDIKEHVTAEGDALRQKGIGTDASTQRMPDTQNAAYHWDEYFKKIESEMGALGITERQREVALGILDHQSYTQIAHHMRLQERTVRDHAKLLFNKVGCVGKADFPHAVLRALKAVEDNARTETSKL